MASPQRLLAVLQQFAVTMLKPYEANDVLYDLGDHVVYYREAAVQLGFTSVVGIPLAISGNRLGSLNVYDTAARDWNSDDLHAAQVLADIATAYIVRAGELTEARELATQLQYALDSRIVIEQAKGMLAREHEITVDQAFDMIRSHSRNNNVPLRSIAAAVVELNLQLPQATS